MQEKQSHINLKQYFINTKNCPDWNLLPYFENRGIMVLLPSTPEHIVYKRTESKARTYYQALLRVLLSEKQKNNQDQNHPL